MNDIAQLVISSIWCDKCMIFTSVLYATRYEFSIYLIGRCFIHELFIYSTPTFLEMRLCTKRDDSNPDFSWCNFSNASLYLCNCNRNCCVDINDLLTGQVEGAFVQGVGLFTLEELRYSPQGYLFTRGPGMYKIPAFGDIPTELCVSLLRDAPNERAIFSSKVQSKELNFMDLIYGTW